MSQVSTGSWRIESWRLKDWMDLCESKWSWHLATYYKLRNLCLRWNGNLSFKKVPSRSSWCITPQCCTGMESTRWEWPHAPLWISNYHWCGQVKVYNNDSKDALNSSSSSCRYPRICLDVMTILQCTYADLYNNYSKDTALSGSYADTMEMFINHNRNRPSSNGVRNKSSEYSRVGTVYRTSIMSSQA